MVVGMTGLVKDGRGGEGVVWQLVEDMCMFVVDN